MMISRAGLLTAALAVVALSLPAIAQEHQHGEDCSTAAASLPAGMEGWSTRAPLEAATGKAGLRAAQVAIGNGIDAKLKPTPDVHYVVRPEKPGGSVSYGGLFNLRISEAATYRVALGSAAWIDVLGGKTAVESSAHGHGPACSGIRKMVDFPLKPGRYTLQIAANGTPDLSLMVARLP
jgi:hypothetical protein